MIANRTKHAKEGVQRISSGFAERAFLGVDADLNRLNCFRMEIFCNFHKCTVDVPSESCVKIIRTAKTKTLGCINCFGWHFQFANIGREEFIHFAIEHFMAYSKWPPTAFLFLFGGFVAVFEGEEVVGGAVHGGFAAGGFAHLLIDG